LDDTEKNLLVKNCTDQSTTHATLDTGAHDWKQSTRGIKGAGRDLRGRNFLRRLARGTLAEPGRNIKRGRP